LWFIRQLRSFCDDDGSVRETPNVDPTIPHISWCGFRRSVVPCSSLVAPHEDRSKLKRGLPAGKRRTRSRRIVHALLLLVAAVIVVDALVGERGLLAMFRARQEYEELSAAIARQRAENSRLREEARRLREEPAAIEELARGQLGLIKPGEKVFIVKDIPPPSGKQ
jgi:cell division protein FtsB